MRKAILILIFISTQIYSYSQVYDLIVTDLNKSIACHIDSISHDKIYFEMMIYNKWVHTSLNKENIRKYKRNVISGDEVIFEEGTSIIQDKELIKIKPKIYKTWVSLNEEPFKIKGVLYELKDSSILVSNSVIIKDYSTNKFETINLHMNSIETIKTRRKNRIGKGIWIGALSGFVIGGTIGLISGDNDSSTGSSNYPTNYPTVDLSFSSGQTALILALPSAAVGAGIGALVGSIKVKIPIYGNISNYNNQKNKLRKYSIQ